MIMIVIVINIINCTERERKRTSATVLNNIQMFSAVEWVKHLDYI